MTIPLQDEALALYEAFSNMEVGGNADVMRKAFSFLFRPDVRALLTGPLAGDGEPKGLDLTLFRIAQLVDDYKDRRPETRVTVALLDLRRIIAAEFERVTADGWSPIESLPKDAVLFDVWFEEGQRAIDCHWSAAHKAVALKHSYPSITTIFRPQPTHWRPLPTPPTAARGW